MKNIEKSLWPQAAQTIVKHFGSSHTALLLPPLEEGVFDVDWRIRHGAVQLMGQLPRGVSSQFWPSK